ncbi:hypothetical protein E8D34_16875 [Nocardioides sp. GY 10113]|uniref:hypothetical protein n=1 Tax=Nocardioides sp. GY 10113 TaxID=2569761 RepID=UPI0010A7792E|nr:hypothetical protein [Nocardioides sp. GY 10113]TIC82490.1 hypothetical protein E8D34_16875 [Nocardioides sp. GY 10113]
MPVRRRLARLSLLTAMIIPVAILTAPLSPAQAVAGTAAECHWINQGGMSAKKICTDYNSSFPGSRVHGDISGWMPNISAPQYTINLELWDTKKDGHCTWIQVRKIKSSFNLNYMEPGSKVCGLGESKLINVEHIGTAAGTLKILHCRDTDAGGKTCTVFARQVIKQGL